MGRLVPDERSSAPEKMDDSAADERKLINTVRQFKTINMNLSASKRLLKRYIISEMKAGSSTPYTYLDVGAGGCHIGRWLAGYCRKKKIPVRITCLDNDPRILEYAEGNVRDFPEIEIAKSSVFDLGKKTEYDFIFSNHFLHHFKNDEIGEILDLLRGMTRIRLLMNDLKRAGLSYYGYKIFAGLFFHDSFAAYDGGLSILKGFTRREMESIIRRTDAPAAFTVGEAFPGRMYVTCRGPDSD